MPLDKAFASCAWRNTPNAISIARLCANGILLAAVLTRHIDLFKWLLLACLLSDVLDGLIARAFRLTSTLGASLDSIADIVTMFVGLIGFIVFQQAFFIRHSPGFLLVGTMYAGEVAASFWRYGKVSSFHTALNRIAASLAGLMAMSLFFGAYRSVLYQATIAAYLVALSEEMLLIYFLPQWRRDVGGLVQVLSNRRLTPEVTCPDEIRGAPKPLPAQTPQAPA